MNAIECKNVLYRYPNTRKTSPPALRGVSLDVRQGEVLAMIGHTGSGKSTLAQHLNGLLKPVGGTVCVGGKDIWATKSAMREARFRVGLCFQYPEYQLFEETIAKDIAFGPKNMGLDPAEIDRRVRAAARYVGLTEEMLPRSPFDLSGGEKRRAAIAGVMAMEPEVLALDEPTAGLDPRGKERILQMILRYRAETRKPILLISHNMEDVARFADRVLVLNQGEAAMLGTVPEVFSRAEELTAMGLNVPSVTRIFLELRRRGLPVSAGIYSVEQGVAELLRLRALRKEGIHD
ncbi:MAG: energy-coupling factor transporter ATPase [Oscillospiraceae bacterium]|jgi:energy-coupling factor transport system ATP-binding protein|nr:energy-coupling factor transporter ATPase [Oscillospiraceae bacterium]